MNSLSQDKLFCHLFALLAVAVECHVWPVKDLNENVERSKCRWFRSEAPALRETSEWHSSQMTELAFLWFNQTAWRSCCQLNCWVASLMLLKATHNATFAICFIMPSRMLRSCRDSHQCKQWFLWSLWRSPFRQCQTNKIILCQCLTLGQQRRFTAAFVLTRQQSVSLVIQHRWAKCQCHQRNSFWNDELCWVETIQVQKLEECKD